MPSFPKSLHCISESRSINSATTVYFAYGTGRLRESTTEANRQVVVRTAGRISSLLMNLPNNTLNGDCVVTLRKNGQATALTYTIIAGATGTFVTPADKYVDVVAGDLLCYETANAGNSGAASWGQISTIFEVASASAPKTCAVRLVCSGVGGSITPASTTRYTEIAGDVDLSGTVETDKNIRIYTDGTMKNLGVYVSANTRSTDTVVTLKINTPGAGTLTVTIPGGGTGWFEDTTHSDAITNGDNLNYQVVTGTGTGTITIETMAMDFVTTNGKFPMITSFTSGANVNFNVTTYTSCGGLSFSTTESFRSPKNRMRLLVTGLYCYVFSNTIATNDSTIALRVGGQNSALSLAVVAGGTGIGSDTLNSAMSSALDSITFQVATPNTSGALNIRSIAVVCEFLETVKPQGIGGNFGLSNGKRRTIIGRRQAIENLGFPM